MCWRNFCNFPWWLKNVKCRSKITLFFKWAPFWNLISKKREQLLFSWSKLSKLYKKDPIFACGNYIFPKTKGNKNKPWTHSTPLKCFAQAQKMVWVKHLLDDKYDSMWKSIELSFLYRFHPELKILWKSHAPEKVLSQLRNVQLSDSLRSWYLF